MKKLSGLLIFIILALSCAVFAACEDLNGEEALNDSVSVTFFLDNSVYSNESIVKGTKLKQPQLNLPEGKVFKGWYTSTSGTQTFNFEQTVYTDLKLYGYTYDADDVKYTVMFMADDEIIEVQTVAANEVVEPIQYDGKFGYEFLYWSYNGLEFDFNERINNDITLVAKLRPIYYTVKFFADGNQVGAALYSLEDKNINLPLIPPKEHYTAAWENFELSGGDVTVHAVYTPIEYKITFMVDGRPHSYAYYTVEDDEIELPELEERKGYTYSWSEYSLDGGDLTISATYTPIKYTVHFIISRTETIDVPYTVEQEFPNYPEIPEQEGYAFRWSEPQYSGTDIYISLIRDLIIYTAEFYIGDELVFSVEYSKLEPLETPEIPEKYNRDGFTVAWEEFESKMFKEDKMTVHAVYTPIE